MQLQPPPSREVQFELYKRIQGAQGIRDYSRRIIHYTNESKLELILRSQELWFGRLSEMNDTAEVDHFLDGIVAALPSQFVEFSKQQFIALAEAGRSAIREGTFVSSWCEYEDPDGDLKMWTSYAPSETGVGIVIDSSQFQPSSLVPKNLGFFINSTRVEYVRFGEALALANRLMRQVTGVQGLAPMHRLAFVAALLAKAPCVKHQAYASEKEVRFLTTGGIVAALNKIIPVGSQFPDFPMKRVGERTFLAVPLQNYSEFGFDLRIEKILLKVVVAPGSRQHERASTLRALLDAYNCNHVEVATNSIPFR